MKYFHQLSSFTIALAVSITIVSCHKNKQADDKTAESLTVSVAYPSIDSITITREYPGQLSSVKSLDVVARVNGVIRKIYFNDGQYVKKGDILFSIEDTKYRDAVRQAEAQLATAEATADYATRQHAAMKKAYTSQAVSQMDVIKAESAMNEANASISSAKATLELARTNLGYCTVRALSDGHIAASNVVEGQLVTGENSPVVLTTIYDDSTVYANFAVEDAQYVKLCDSKSKNMINLDSVAVTFNDNMIPPVAGKLDYVAPDVNTGTGTIELRLIIPNKEGVLKSGMYVKVHLPVEASPEAILVKDAAVSTDQRGKYVYTVNEKNQVVYTAINIGDTYNDSLRVVISGLTPQEKYVTEALLKVKPGMTVNPVVVK